MVELKNMYVYIYVCVCVCVCARTYTCDNVRAKGANPQAVKNLPIIFDSTQT